MSAQVLSGKQLASEKREDMKASVQALKEKGVTPGLAVILVGEDPASQTYVRNKQKACENTGIHSELIELPETTPENELLSRIEELNRDESIDGILVQLPLPSHISEQSVIEAIAPSKDVDCFHPTNVGKMMIGEEGFLPCTPHGILVMLKESGVDIAGKHAVIIGRSNIVGKPVGQLLLNEHATVTYCHSRTPNLREMTRQADILVVAVGRYGVVGGEDIKEGAVVIDVGMNRVEGKLRGDVEFESAKEKASLITPVPGGVGPMTITMLLDNTIHSARKRS
ncbi:bifunctional methylenetetrahydrofolate dehydrogenase/methenyltetrahydrofolate cyclohydrolase FolD [Shouchella shacheensis]|uniref:bifunctional methylenetetrahydrofolate dehydrogenase/methenyltetrahydrofolate cyclohydrolase FolD n=1 Tax=Shouchella shacheensis TaxID=1649580 RepID=UPI00073FDFDC|nr:bifunctional methylenetetrahydrofolate dehydrogenase/methenyltetrahydrofolate cyclohydrolase FolD [Shouchella shacheensis]